MEVPTESFHRSSWDSRTCYPWRATNLTWGSQWPNGVWGDYEEDIYTGLGLNLPNNPECARKWEGKRNIVAGIIHNHIFTTVIHCAGGKESQGVRSSVQTVRQWKDFVQDSLGPRYHYPSHSRYPWRSGDEERRKSKIMKNTGIITDILFYISPSPALWAQRLPAA